MNIAYGLTTMPIRVILRLFILVIVATVCLLLAACNRQTGALTESTSETEKIDLVMSTTKALTTEQVSSEPMNDSLNFDTYIILDDEKTTINGEGASFQNDTLTITKGGKYSIKGTLRNGRILVDSKDKKKKVKLVFSGVDITSTTNAPLIIENSHKETILVLAKDTENILSDGSIISSLNEGDTTSIIHSSSPLRIDGRGTLTVNANRGKGIYCKSLDIRNEAKVSITSIGDAIKAESDIEISGGTLNITSGGGATGINYEDVTEESNETKPTLFAETDPRPSDKTFDNSSDGIFSKRSVVISGGNIKLTSSGRGISTKNIVISGGTLSLSSDRSGIFANENILISGGEINITNSFKGIKSDRISLSGGKLIVKSQSDGLCGSDSSVGYQMLMSGGYAHIDCKETENTNGNALLSGGTFVAFPSGNFKTSFIVSGGTLLLVGDERFSERITATGDIELRSFNNKQKANQFFAIVEENEDEAVIGFFSSKDFSSIAIATEEIDDDERYNLYQGGAFHGRALGEVYIDCDYDYGTLIGSLS